MLPGIGGVEYLVIAALIIIFVGPKDLPAVLRGFGNGGARLEIFQESLNQALIKLLPRLGWMILNHLLKMQVLKILLTTCVIQLTRPS